MQCRTYDWIECPSPFFGPNLTTLMTFLSLNESSFFSSKLPGKYTFKIQIQMPDFKIQILCSGYIYGIFPTFEHFNIDVNFNFSLRTPKDHPTPQCSDPRGMPHNCLNLDQCFRLLRYFVSENYILMFYEYGCNRKKPFLNSYFSLARDKNKWRK